MTIYTRSFTGRAKLDDKWAPTDSDELALHQAPLAARGHIYAHADHTPFRALYAPAGAEGSEAGKQPWLIEMAIPAEVLLKTAAMCATQRGRFEAEAGMLWGGFESVLVTSGSLSQPSTAHLSCAFGRWAELGVPCRGVATHIAADQNRRGDPTRHEHWLHRGHQHFLGLDSRGLGALEATGMRISVLVSLTWGEIDRQAAVASG